MVLTLHITVYIIWYYTRRLDMQLLKEKLPARLMKRIIIPTIGGILLIVFSSLVLYEALSVEVVLAKDGKVHRVKTHANTVEELLEELGIELDQHDYLSNDLKETLQQGMNIEYKQAKKIILTVDGEEKEFYTTAGTLEEFFEEEQLTFTEHDELSHQPHQEITENLHITAKKAYPVTIQDGGRENRYVWTTGGSVSQLLEQQDITLNELDQVSPQLEAEVGPDTTIMITRIEKVTEVVEETIPFDVERKKDNQLAKGKEKVISEGQEGLVEKTIEITLENGKEVNREVIQEEVKQESKNKVIAVGTKEPTVTKVASTSQSKSTKSASKEPSSGKVLYMNATAFTANCKGCSGITATGINLKANPHMKVIAVDPNVIPLGSKVWVEGYGTAIAGDTGGSIKGNRIDAHFPTKAEAYKFGKRTVKVKILE